MSRVRIKINRAGYERILKVASAPVVKTIADRIAASTESLAGMPGGKAPTVTRYDETTSERARSAIVLTHPTPAGRQAANDAALAAMKVAG